MAEARRARAFAVLGAHLDLPASLPAGPRRAVAPLPEKLSSTVPRVIPAVMGRPREQLRRLIAAAEEHAAADGSGAVDTGHLLLAVVEIDEDAAAFLRTVGGAPAALRATLVEAPTSETVPRPWPRVFRRRRLTVEAETAVVCAVAQAGRPRRVGSEHVLAALCGGTASKARDALGPLGVRASDVHVFFARRRGRST